MSIRNPTRILWISAYHGFSTSIPILDLTEKLLPEYTAVNCDVDNSTFRNRLQDVVTQLKGQGDGSWLYLLKKDKWKSRRYVLVPASEFSTLQSPENADAAAPLDNYDSTATPDDDGYLDDSDDVAGGGDYIATIRRSSYLTLSYTMQFPANSVHSSHAIEVKPGTLVPRTQVFVKDSVQYAWEMESGIKDFRQTLVKTQPGNKVAVALFRRLEQLRGLRGKLLLVDETAGVDHVVVLLSTMGTYKGGGG